MNAVWSVVCRLSPFLWAKIRTQAVAEMREATGGTTTIIEIALTSYIRWNSSAEFFDIFRTVSATVSVCVPGSGF